MHNTKNASLFRRIIDETSEFVLAAGRGDVEGVRWCLDKGMHPDTPGPRGWTALCKAATGNHSDVALELLNRGATIDATNYTGKTALMVACAFGQYDVMSLLLLRGANPDLADIYGRTPLMMAASGGYEHIVGALLDHFPKVDLTCKDKKGRTASDMALAFCHNKVAKMLSAACASVVRTSLGLSGTLVPRLAIVGTGGTI